MYLYGAVWSSEQSFISRCCHRKGPLDESLCDSSLAPEDEKLLHKCVFSLLVQTDLLLDQVVLEKKWMGIIKPKWIMLGFTGLCTLAAGRCWVWGYRSQRHWKRSLLIVTNQMILESIRKRK